MEIVINGVHEPFGKIPDERLWSLDRVGYNHPSPLIPLTLLRGEGNRNRALFLQIGRPSGAPDRVLAMASRVVHGLNMHPILEVKAFHEPQVGKIQDGKARSLSVRNGEISVHPPRKATAHADLAVCDTADLAICATPSEIAVLGFNARIHSGNSLPQEREKWFPRLAKKTTIGSWWQCANSGPALPNSRTVSRYAKLRACL